MALSGAHTLGRSRPSRSGFGAEATKFTVGGMLAMQCFRHMTGGGRVVIPAISLPSDAS